MLCIFEFCLKNMWNCSLTQQILSHSFYDWKLCELFLLSRFLICHPVGWYIDVGIPMGTNCAPLLAALFLYSYESEFLQKLVKIRRFMRLEPLISHTGILMTFYLSIILDLQNFFHWYIIQSW
jgi:hypothetical protein